MSRSVLAAGALALAITAAGTPARAQSAMELASSFAAAYTPTAGLAPAVTPFMAGAVHDRMALQLHYANLGMESSWHYDDFGISADIPHGQSTLGLTIADAAPANCPRGGGCASHLMLGGSWSRGLFATGVGAGTERARFSVGLRSDVGFATTSSKDPALPKGTVWSASLGLPIAFAATSGRHQIIPFVTPAMAWGRISSDNGGESGATPMLGGGLGFTGYRGGELAFTLGFQKMLRTSISALAGGPDAANAIVGLTVTWTGMR